MDLRIQFLKAESKLTTEQARILRRYEKHCQRHSTLMRGFSNSKEENLWDRRREDSYTMRKQIGRESRYLGLAKAYVMKKDYLIVENKTKPNNAPKLSEVYTKLIDFGFEVDPVDVQLWLEA
jgi:hypothetical protein